MFSQVVQGIEKLDRPERRAVVSERFSDKPILVDAQWVDHVKGTEESGLPPHNLLPPQAHKQLVIKDVTKANVEVDLTDIVFRKNKPPCLVFVVEVTVLFTDEIDGIKTTAVDE